MRKPLRNILIILVIFAILLGILVVVSTYNIIHENALKKAAIYRTPVNYPQYPKPNLAGKTQQQIGQIKRGEYLVKVGDCITCHTNTFINGKPFAGGLAIHTPYGTLYSPNITPDKKTGIGTWQSADFIKAMRYGISPDNHYYYPAFPYLYYNKITTKDLLSIKAYLDAIPAVNDPDRPAEMIWPFNFRFLQLGWRLLFFNGNDTGPFVYNPNKSDIWNRGAYLVEGLGHCGMCHTPSHHLLTDKLPLAAPIRRYNLTGADIQGYLAPDISKVAIGQVPDKELMEAFTKYQSIKKIKFHGPMVEVTHNSLIYLTKDDLLAIITYLKSVKSITPPSPSLKNLVLGKAIYKNHCSVCHNLGINGAPKIGNPTDWRPLIDSGVEKLYIIAIEGNAIMPAKGGCSSCSEKDIKAAVDYIVDQSAPPRQKNH